MKATCSETKPEAGATRRVSTRRLGAGEEGAYLNGAGGHLELRSEFFAEDGVGLGVFAEDVFEDLELVS